MGPIAVGKFPKIFLTFWQWWRAHFGFPQRFGIDNRMRFRIWDNWKMQGQPRPPTKLEEEARRWGVGLVMLAVAGLIRYFDGPLWLIISLGGIGAILVIRGYFRQLFSLVFWTDERLALSLLLVAWPVGTAGAIYAAKVYVQPIPFTLSHPSVPSRDVLVKPFVVVAHPHVSNTAVVQLPLVITLQSDGNGYSGKAYGIAWNPDYQKVSMIVANEAAVDYGDLDLVVDAGGLTIVGLAQINQSPVTPSISPVLDPIAGGSIAFVDEKGNKTPLQLSKEQDAPKYRLKSTSISSHSAMEFVVAIGKFDLSFRNIQLGGKLTVPIKNVFVLRVAGHYFIGKRKVDLEKEQQLIR